MSGGTFALYSLLCRHAKFSLLPNQQAADEELSAYKYGPSSEVVASSPLKRFLEKHKRLRTALLVVVLLGASMVIGDGVLTPAISGKVLGCCCQTEISQSFIFISSTYCLLISIYLMAITSLLFCIHVMPFWNLRRIRKRNQKKKNKHKMTFVY